MVGEGRRGEQEKYTFRKKDEDGREEAREHGRQQADKRKMELTCKSNESKANVDKTFVNNFCCIAFATSSDVLYMVYISYAGMCVCIVCVLMKAKDLRKAPKQSISATAIVMLCMCGCARLYAKRWSLSWHNLSTK